MGRIRVLAPEVRSKIAAGEVVSRPNSVIKELIENSLDAQARRIEIEIEDGGKKKCLVNDDGIGMSREDALLSIERYATSKITTIDDIENINTYGFRGEALASIAQVSVFELETSDDTQGTHIEIVGGELKGIHDSSRPIGTRVKVSTLFFNLPVRLKFLKSSEWERRLIIETVKVYALISPNVSFTLGESNRGILNLSSIDSIEKRIKILFPINITDYLKNIEFNLGPITFSGFFSQPDFFENHNLNYLYVNFRPVRYPRIYRTILGAYQYPKTPPAFLLNIIIDPKLVDVNIHPTKSEVRFKDERYVVDLLTQVIKESFFSKTVKADYGSVKMKEEESATELSAHYVQEQAFPYKTQETEKPAKESSEFWQLHNTYILAQTKSGMIIVDQHVASERIIYESIMSGKAHSQRLLFPITLDLAPEDYEIYKQTKELLEELGVEFKEFSSRTIVIDSLPTDVEVSREDLGGLFKEIGKLDKLMKEKGEIAKVIACHSAIKAGQKLTVIEMQSLIDRLFACENPYICPHGRPIVLKYTLEDLAHKFGR